MVFHFLPNRSLSVKHAHRKGENDTIMMLIIAVIIIILINDKSLLSLLLYF